jgi:hypothetical protein
MLDDLVSQMYSNPSFVYFFGKKKTIHLDLISFIPRAVGNALCLRMKNPNRKGSISHF